MSKKIIRGGTIVTAVDTVQADVLIYGEKIAGTGSFDGVDAEVPDAPTELEPTLRSMQVPTLVMFGDDDRTVSAGLSAEGYLMLPSDIRHLHVIHGADHSPNGALPQQTTDVVRPLRRP